MKSILLKTTLFLALLLLINQLVMAQTTTTLDKTHPAYSELTALQRHVKSIQKYYDKGQFTTTMNTYLGYAQKSIEKMKSEFPDVDISTEVKQYETAQKAYNEKTNADSDRKNTATNDLDYFRGWDRILGYFYNEYGEFGASWLKHPTDDNQAALKQILAFNKEEYLQHIEDSKRNGTYERLKFYSDKFLAALADYDKFIERSEVTFNQQINYLNEVGIKGNPEKELEQLKSTQTMCEVLLTFSPNNADAKRWLAQVKARMGDKANKIEEAFTSNFHKEHLNQVVFSKKELTIGSESESDITTDFKAGDYIYGTVYLPNTVRQAQDSYALLYVNIYVNGDFLATMHQTGVWVTTPMQENTYLQFALSPNQDWISKNYQNYVDNENFTLGQFNEFLASKGNYQHKVELEVKFRTSAGGKIKGKFNIDLSNNGSEFYAELGKKLKNKTLSGVSLPQAGMRDTNLQAQMLDLVKRTYSSNGTEYTKAIIVSKNWDIETNRFTGVIIGRSIQGALVSKKSDGTCAFQYFLFKQDYNGSGYNSNLKNAGVGDLTIIPCENIK